VYYIFLCRFFRFFYRPSAAGLDYSPLADTITFQAVVKGRLFESPFVFFTALGRRPTSGQGTCNSYSAKVHG
jgi:hypothetical protein